jgi:hypothetical protein
VIPPNRRSAGARCVCAHGPTETIEPRSQDAGFYAVAETHRANKSKSLAGGLEDRTDHQCRDRSAQAAGDTQGQELARGVTCQGLADPRVCRPGVTNDDLKPAGLDARPLYDHAGRAPFERLAYKKMAVIARPCVGERDEHLARVEPAMIVGATGDFPINTAYKLAFGEQPPQAH